MYKAYPIAAALALTCIRPHPCVAAAPVPPPADLSAAQDADSSTAAAHPT